MAKAVVLLRIIPTATYSIEEVKYTSEAFKTIRKRLVYGAYNFEVSLFSEVYANA